MKFKAVVSERGLRCLTKGFAPMLEKFGRTVQVLLGPEAVHLVQDKGNTDGAHLTARISKAVLFERGTLTIGSKHRDLIAFSMDLQMLVRVLRAAMEMGAESLEVKLAVRQVQVDTEGSVESRPFLSFAGRGVALNLDMDMTNLLHKKLHVNKEQDLEYVLCEIAHVCYKLRICVLSVVFTLVSNAKFNQSIFNA